jgi:hypothetical protein
MLKFEKHECMQYDKGYPDLIKSWWGHPEKFRADTHDIYATVSLEAHMICVVMMLCRLFRKKRSTHFSLAWVPIMHKVAKGYSFNLANMLSDNLAKEITEYQLEKSKGQPSPFYMSAYIMDVIFFMTPFPLMNWSWNPTSVEPIHFYHSKLWEDKARYFFYEIFHYVVVPIHITLYNCPPPRISDKIMGNLGRIVDLYIEEKFSSIRVFGCSVPPHALPNFLPDRLVCQEVSYQTVTGGIIKELKVAQKKVWPTFLLQVGMFYLLDFGHSKEEATALEDVKFVDIEFKRHDPQKIMENQLSQYNLKRYMHENSPHDEVLKGARSYEEVLNKVQTLSPDQHASFFSFKKHKRNNLPKVLQGELVSTSPTQETVPPIFGAGSSRKQDTEENPKNTEVLMQRVGDFITKPIGHSTKGLYRSFSKAGARYVSFYTSHICCQNR